jgi:U6 snRNA-associated Sm-like protein LSm1
MEDVKLLPGWASSFDDLLDKRVVALLIDGRNIVGFLRSYDQFANIMIDDAYERHIADSLFADVFLGVMIIRGENLALFGDSTDDGHLIEAPIDIVLRRQAEIHDTVEAHRGVTIDLGFLDDI